ncbi:cyclopropane-fatty-acyl-phospholipid synthase, partial [Tanacetum coccineum]
MLEAVGHEYMQEFFGCCESILADDGLFVLQFISIPDQRYDEYRRSSDFIKEYIFPGGCLPSLSRVTSAMAASSRLCVEHVENIGIHYYQTLRYWRTNFLEKQSKIRALGFDQKFIRTWEYYFDYCAAGFKTQTLGDYQWWQMYHSSPAAMKASASSAALPPPPSSMELKSSPPKTTTIHPTWFSFRGNTTRDSPLHAHPNNERVPLLAS